MPKTLNLGRTQFSDLTHLQLWTYLQIPAAGYGHPRPSDFAPNRYGKMRMSSLLGTVRRECRDRVLIFGEAHLRTQSNRNRRDAAKATLSKGPRNPGT